MLSASPTWGEQRARVIGLAAGNPRLCHESHTIVENRGLRDEKRELTSPVMSSRPLLSADARTPEAATAASNFHSDIVAEVAETIATEPVVIVGMAVNPFVKKARKALDEAGIAFRYLEYGSYLKGWHKRLAIKMWSGWPTFPQVYVRGTLIGGFQETVEALENGSFQQRISSTEQAA